MIIHHRPNCIVHNHKTYGRKYIMEENIGDNVDDPGFGDEFLKTR